MSDRIDQLSDIRYLAELYSLQRELGLARSTVSLAKGYVHDEKFWRNANEAIRALSDSIDIEMKRTKAVLGFSPFAVSWADAETEEVVE